MTIEGPWAQSPTDMQPWDTPNGTLQGVALAWHTFTDFWGHKVKDYFNELVTLSQTGFKV